MLGLFENIYYVVIVEILYNDLVVQQFWKVVGIVWCVSKGFFGIQERQQDVVGVVENYQVCEFILIQVYFVGLWIVEFVGEGQVFCFFIYCYWEGNGWIGLCI